MEKTKMAKTEAQLKYNAKWKKENIVNVAMQFNRNTEQELIDYLQTLPNKTGHIKDMLKKEIGFGCTHYVLCMNDEDEFRELRLHSTTEEEAVAEAFNVLKAFDGWLKGRIDKYEWHIKDDKGNKTYLFKEQEQG